MRMLTLSNPSTSWRSPWAAAAVGLAAVGLAELVGNTAVRSLVSLPLLAAPGVCLVTAVLGIAAFTLDGVTYWALAVLGSLVALIAEALALTALGVGLDRLTFGLAAAAVLGALGAAATVRVRHRTGAERVREPLRPSAVITFAAVTAVGVLAAVVAGRLLPGPVPPDYVAFNASGSWANVQRTVPVQPGQTLRIPIELHPSPQSPTSGYRITTQLDGRQVEPAITHRIWHGTSYYAAVTVPTPSDGCRHRLTVNGQADDGWRGELVMYLQGPSSLGCAQP